MSNEWYYITTKNKKDEQIRSLRRDLVFPDDDRFTISDGVPIISVNEIFQRQDSDFSLQYATLQWKKEREARGIEDCDWDDVKKEERGQHWRLVYRFYPKLSGISL